MSTIQNNLSEGNLLKQLIGFSIPVLLSNIIQTLYNIIDMIIIGHFSGTNSMSGVTNGTMVSILITNFVVGLGTGATVLIGQYVGAGKDEEKKETISTLYIALTGAAILVTVLMLLFNRPIMAVIQVPSESFQEACNYLIATSLGTFFIFLYNGLAAMMRGLGDSKRPLYFVALACVINIFLDIFFVGFLKGGAFGAGIATAISQGLSALFCIIYLKKQNFCFYLSKKDRRFSKKRLRLLLKLGMPTALQSMLTTVSFIIITAMINTFGVIASAGVGAIGKVNGFAILPATAMSAAVSAICAQNLGAGKEKRAVRAMWSAMVFVLLINTVIFFLIRAFSDTIMLIFTTDPAVIDAGNQYLVTFSYEYLLCAVLNCLTGLFIGAGHTFYAMASSVCVSILVRIPIAYFFGFYLDMGLSGVGLGGPIASAAAIVAGLVFYVSGHWKKTVIK